MTYHKIEKTLNSLRKRVFLRGLYWQQKNKRVKKNKIK